MEERKKKKLNSILIWGGLAFLILFVVITSIVLNYQRKKLDEIQSENDRITASVVVLQERGDN